MTVIAREIAINALPEKVWAVLSDYEGVAKWAPDVVSAHATTEESQGVGATRLCATSGFGDIEEIVTDWREGESLSYSVTGNLPLRDVLMAWTLRAEGGQTVAQLRANYEIKEGGPEAVMDRLNLRRTLAGAFETALLGLKYHVETGELVGDGLPDGLKGEEPIEVAA